MTEYLIAIWTILILLVIESAIFRINKSLHRIEECLHNINESQEFLAMQNVKNDADIQPGFTHKAIIKRN